MKLKPPVMAVASGLAAVVDMNMLSGPYGCCGFADSHAIFDDRVPLCNVLAGHFMPKRDRLLEHEAVACHQHIGVEVQ